MTAFWSDSKTTMVMDLGISRDAAHVLVGLAIFLLAAAILRRSVLSFWPWFILFCAECVNEINDFWRWGGYEQAPDYLKADLFQDIWLTFLTPALISLIALACPTVFAAPRWRNPPEVPLPDDEPQ